MGVIKVLAEINIPIDLIAGTSVGSVVGGALAAGMTADEIEAMAHGVRWRSSHVLVLAGRAVVQRSDGYIHPSALSCHSF